VFQAIYEAWSAWGIFRNADDRPRDVSMKVKPLCGVVETVEPNLLKIENIGLVANRRSP
jgi:hypothetical protein